LVCLLDVYPIDCIHRPALSGELLRALAAGGMQVTKVPKDVQRERALEAKVANAARKREAHEKNASKTRMKGKNRATSRHRKRQDNIIEVLPLPSRSACCLFFGKCCARAATAELEQCVVGSRWHTACVCVCGFCSTGGHGRRSALQHSGRPSSRAAWP
jgi:hypothetical protein